MPTDTAKELAAFLESTESTPTEVVEITAIPAAAATLPPPAPVVSTIIEPPVVESISPSATEMMTTIIADLKRIGMIAKNLHYRAKGKPFYGIHLLADLIWDVEKETDDLIEVFFMGEQQIEPPLMENVCEKAIALNVLFPKNKNYYEGGLKHICRKTMLDVEAVKKAYPDLCAGTNAVLDTISQKCLVAIGLLAKTEE